MKEEVDRGASPELIARLHIAAELMHRLEVEDPAPSRAERAKIIAELNGSLASTRKALRFTRQPVPFL